MYPRDPGSPHPKLTSVFARLPCCRAVLFPGVETFRRLGDRLRAYSYYQRFGQTLSGKARADFERKLARFVHEAPSVLALRSTPGARASLDGKPVLMKFFRGHW